MVSSHLSEFQVKSQVMKMGDWSPTGVRLETAPMTRVSPCDSSRPLWLESAPVTRVTGADSICRIFVSWYGGIVYLMEK